jgi:hypothetical protein
VGYPKNDAIREKKRKVPEELISYCE